MSQLGLSKNNLDSLEAVRQEMNISCHFLEWSGLRSAIPSHNFMRNDNGIGTITKLVFVRNDAFFDVSLTKGKQYYNLLIQLKATLPIAALKKLKDKFNIQEDLSEVYQ